MRFENGVRADSVAEEAEWRKSQRSVGDGNCVEVALAGGEVAVRNSRDPQGPALIYTPAEFAAFAQGVKDGEFDDLIA
ncbi:MULTISPECIES: DUF397 domain-containing protein [Streptomyces]|uniref:DUF397 domain-containing protein n=1 Tax=Streptomyces TaxID=1883 RepID=UPI001B35A0F6|nr:DUF397 domain-containing protein [Streptomyces sp. B15]MBQ1121916.1 DUF397 domain-containing protein [Streptomyces sp. B15]